MFKTFRRGGVHPNPEKLTRGEAIKPIRTGSLLYLSMSQSIGAPAKPCVKAGDEVEAGDKIGEAGGFVSANVHSPVKGKVKKVEQVRNGAGFWVDAVVIEPDNPEELIPVPDTALNQDAFREAMILEPKEIVSRIREAGIVGLGGAAFPTAVKLSIPEGKSADSLLLNGAECEPYLTCDDALMRSYAPQILAGAILMARAVNASKVKVGIEANKPEAVKIMREASRELGHGVEIIELKTKYPQGSEKQLIEAMTGRIVPAGGLPVDAHVVVDNVATAFAAYEAVCLGLPLTRRVLTVTGESMTGRGNFWVPLGTQINQLTEIAGGLPQDGPVKVLAGGPMMGQAVAVLSAPTVKANGGITVLNGTDILRRMEENCIRCARCVDACPMGLQPHLIATLGKLGLAPEAKEEGIMNCLECGCCSYVCPSWRHLVDYIRIGKTLIRKELKK